MALQHPPQPEVVKPESRAIEQFDTPQSTSTSHLERVLRCRTDWSRQDRRSDQPDGLRCCQVPRRASAGPTSTALLFGSRSLNRTSYRNF